MRNTHHQLPTLMALLLLLIVLPMAGCSDDTTGVQIPDQRAAPDLMAPDLMAPDLGPPDAWACGVGSTLCAGVCVDVNNDNSNCGGCGKACAAGQVCSQGTCGLSCQSGLTDCSG